jgi:hypothetical protein
MKNSLFLALLMLAACAEQPPQPPLPQPAYQFDTAAYALQQGWDKVDVKGPGIAYDARGQAYVVMP